MSFFILGVFVSFVFTPTSPTQTSSAHCLRRATGHGRTLRPSWLEVSKALRTVGTLGLHREHSCKRHCTGEMRQGLHFYHCHLHLPKPGADTAAKSRSESRSDGEPCTGPAPGNQSPQGNANRPEGKQQLFTALGQKVSELCRDLGPTRAW